MGEVIRMKPMSAIAPSLKFVLECIDELENEHRDVCDCLQNMFGIKRWDGLLTMDREALTRAEHEVEYGCASGWYGETELFAVAATVVWKDDAEDRWEAQMSPLEKAIRSLTRLDGSAERAHYAAEFEDARRRADISQWTDLLRRDECALCDIGAYAWAEYRGRVSGAIDDTLDWRREMDAKEWEAEDGPEDDSLDGQELLPDH